jgi:HlyD family secretion protein
MPRAYLHPSSALAAGIVLMALATGCERPSEGKAGSVDQPVRLVEIVHPERHTIRRSVGVPGELQAFQTTPVHAKIAGYVKDWTVNIGSKVKKGQVLAELSVPEMEVDLLQKRAAADQAVAKHKLAGAAVRVAEANLAGAQAKLGEVQAGIPRAQANLALWKAQYRRVQQLFDEKAQTGSLLDETQNSFRSSEATLKEVQAQVKTAEVALVQSQAALESAHADVGAAAAAIEVAKQDARHAEALLGYAKIEAPFDGIVTRRNVNTGDLTKPGADQPPLFIVAQSDIVTIRVDVPEAFAVEVEPGDRVEVKLQEMKGKTIQGKVTRTSWAVDTKVRTIRVEIDIPNPGNKLLPGLYAYATVIVEEHPDVLTVPTTAVVNEKDKSYCVAVVDGKAARCPIELGLNDGTRTEIVSGLNGGETVVKANPTSLTDGQPVRIEQPAVK